MNPKRKANGKSLLMLLALVALCFSGCGTLDKSGVYGGDKVLYDADLTIVSSYTLLHQFVLFEYQNRAALAGTPEVTKFADEVRKGSPQWFASAIALRDAYKGNPADATRAALQQALDVLRESTVQATKYLSRSAGAPAAPAK